MRRLLFAAVVAVVAATPAMTYAQPADWGVTRDPFDKNVIARYKAILAQSPHDASALAKLLEMYRRYRTVDLLKGEYQKQLDKKADDWASLVVLGRLMHATGDDARARDLWAKAVAAKSTDPDAWIDIGELDKGAGHNKDARADYDNALAHASSKDMKKKALRALADLALATGDNDGANAYFKQFLDLDPNNAQLWIERGDAMLAAGKRDVALESYAAAEKLLGSDPPRRVEVVARRGQALEGLGKDDDAIAEYKRAIKLAPKGYYLEVELTGRIIDIYRRKQALPQLLAEYEKEWPEGMRGHFEWDTLGKLYEETGAQDKAIAALKKAVAKAPYELETQRRLIQLLENSGRDDEALAQYEVVVRVAPGEARFQLELAERYWRRNDEKKALEVLARLEQRFPQDPSVLGAIADLYTRYNKEDLAITEYERLAKLEPDDISHLVTLGEQYYQKGDKTRAMATWKRIIANNKAASYAKLGEVLAEHGQSFYTEAEKNYQKAIELDPKNPELYKGRASLHEAKKENDKALDDWKIVLSLLGNKPSDRLARRDARRHLVTVLFKANKEASAVADWTRDFGRPPTIGADKKPVYDPIASEAGYFLVEYWSRPGRTKAGEPRATLEKLVAMVPDDQDLVLDLVKSYRTGTPRKYDEAVALLLKLAHDVPSREREVFKLISEIKSDGRQDAESIEWQQKAVAKSPNDPSAYEGLGERYAEMQRFPEAITAYERTVQLDPRDSKAAFALAQLYIQTGTPMKATELYRNILRNDTDEEVLRRAGDQAIDLEEMTGTLGELEKVLSPLSFMMAHKPVYREELIDLYLRYVPLLASRLHHGNDEVKRAARAELDRISAHGLRPLLEALRDDRNVGQQRMAVEVLGYLGNKGAAPPLVHMARQEPSKEQRHIGTLAETLDRDIRVDALVAAGRLGDPGVIEDVLPMMDHQEVALREAATFTVGRSQDRRAVAPLVKALGDRQTSVQVLACLGLAQIDDARVAPAVIAVAKDPSRLDAVRAACTYAIGARRIAAATPILLAALDDNRGDTQRLAAWALGQLGTGQALGPLLRAYFARAGQSADELVWAIARVSGAGLAPAPIADLGEYPIHAGKFDKDAEIATLPGSLPHAPTVGKLVTDHATDIAAGLAQALAEHRDVVVSVLADLDAAPDQLALGALTPPPSDPKAAAALATVARTIAGDVTAHLGDDDPKVRALAISVTAKLDAPATAADIAKALADPTEQVRAAAMNAIAVVAHRRGTAPPELVGALAKTLASAGWEDRRAAALALGRLGAKADADALVKAATDSSSFVREAVAIALGQVGGPKAAATLARLAHDDVPQVQEAATRSLSQLKN
ncbi:MAG TPA: HEAT repeat domain-containing protein [Kofleriaceae bacterium]|jgi:tetratricopeptide (TPR) repeat protein/HEAT repeat protein